MRLWLWLCSQCCPGLDYCLECDLVTCDIFWSRSGPPGLRLSRSLSQVTGGVTHPGPRPQTHLNLTTVSWLNGTPTTQKHFLIFNDSLWNIVSSKYFKAKMKQGEIIYLLFIVQWPLVSSINHLSPYTFSQTGKYTGWRQKTFITASAHPSSYHYKFQESGPCFFGVNSSTELREIPQKC